ncbi:MAG: BrnA antitoxin family protein [Candidatus Accumulibacter sp.]|nr:BrnA antitoxin family protein [Accumulibacter sp.]
MDVELIDRFKAMAGKRGYQTLINETLKNSLRQSSAEATVYTAVRNENERGLCDSE